MPKQDNRILKYKHGEKSIKSMNHIVRLIQQKISLIIINVKIV